MSSELTKGLLRRGCQTFEQFVHSLCWFPVIVC
jgi:hypothetical protein